VKAHTNRGRRPRESERKFRTKVRERETDRRNARHELRNLTREMR